MKAIEFTSLILCLLFSSCYTANFVEEPIVPFLPPLLKFQNGTRVTGVASWEERRLEVQSLLQNYILGTLPNTRGPKLTKVDVVNSSSYGQGDSQAFSTFLNLHFDTSDGGVVNAVSYEVELLFPRAQAGDKCPLFLTQWNHRNWALTALSRGYCAIVYPGSDVRDAAPTFQRAYPKASMMLILARAYVASITLDMFFYDIPGTAALPRILKDQICITGHSRNGKQSLLAASIDDRFSAVVGSSPGSPIASPYHMSSHNFYGEGPDAGRAGFWWLNSTLKYAAHPEKLPMDGHGVMASIAPRRAAIANGWTDHEGDISFADECNVRAAMEVYKLYNAEENLRIIHRPGDHHGFDDINTYIDYFDYGFGRLSKIFPLSWVGQTDTKTYPFPMSYLTPAGFNWDVWFDAFGKHTPPPPNALGSANFIDRIKWLLQLGDEPTVFTKGATYAEDSATGTFRYRSVMMGTDFENWKSKYKIHRQPLSFGNYVTANLFWAENATAKKQCPLVIWLHPFSYGTGYYASYIRGNPVVDLTQAGFCVLAFDHIGMATRVNEGGTNFYARHGPKASLFGQMVKDVKSALDAMECLTEEGRKNQSLCGTGSNFNGPYLPFPMPGTPTLDKSHFVLAGYSLGGNVALHAAALDNRVTAVASFAGFTPFKTDWNNKTTGGIKRLYSFHALIPRLGIFKDKYDEIPYDYDELLSSLIAPRPILLHTPMEDRDATFKDVNDCISLAKIAWEGKYADLFTHSISSGYTVMGKNESNILIEWLKKMQN